MDYTIAFEAPAEKIYLDLISREYWDCLMDVYRWFTPMSEITHFRSDTAGTDIVFTQNLPREHLPPVARTVMPVDMIITREQHFAPFDAKTNTATGTFRASVPLGRGHFGGTYRLSDAGERSQFRLNSVCKVSIPLIGGTLEQLIMSNITKLFDAEEAFTADWISKHH